VVSVRNHCNPQDRRCTNADEVVRVLRESGFGCSVDCSLGAHFVAKWLQSTGDLNLSKNVNGVFSTEATFNFVTQRGGRKCDMAPGKSLCASNVGAKAISVQDAALINSITP
jgi:hypothetical protein